MAAKAKPGLTHAKRGDLPGFPWSTLFTSDRQQDRIYENGPHDRVFGVAFNPVQFPSFTRSDGVDSAGMPRRQPNSLVAMGRP